MKRIRTLLVTFANDIGQLPITAFRGAVIEKVGRENLLFHHHLSDDTYLYKYPLIQYKKIGRQPGIFCLDEGVDEIHKLFFHKTWEINMYGKPMKLAVDELMLQNCNLNINGQMNRYKLVDWQGLNAKNYAKFIGFENMDDRIALLERILVGNILSFAKGVDWHIDDQIVVMMESIERVVPKKFKNQLVCSFELTFISNVILPEYVGLGKAVSTGSGMIKYS